MVVQGLAAAKRLRKELQNLQRHKDEDDDICLIPDSDNILKWAALIRGPKDTPYESGVFHLSIVCGTDYPLAPPTMTFVTKVCKPSKMSFFTEQCWLLHRQISLHIFVRFSLLSLSHNHTGVSSQCTFSYG